MKIWNPEFKRDVLRKQKLQKLGMIPDKPHAFHPDDRRMASMSATEIVKYIASGRGLTLDELFSKKKTLRLVEVRDECIKAISRHKPEYSTNRIGRVMRMHHTTVLHYLGRRPQERMRRSYKVERAQLAYSLFSKSRLDTRAIARRMRVHEEMAERYVYLGRELDRGNMTVTDVALARVKGWQRAAGTS